MTVQRSPTSPCLSPLAGRTPHQAVENFLDPLRRSLARVTRANLIVTPGGHVPMPDPHAATLSGEGPVGLGKDARIAMLMSIQYRIVEAEGERGPWKTTVAQYEYSLVQKGKEVLGFHWHPESRGRVTWPHVHVGTVALARRGALNRRIHIPTGRVAVEDVLRLAIIDLGVESLRDDWETVFRQTQDVFERWRTWP
jgi:hypothetical protein